MKKLWILIGVVVFATSCELFEDTADGGLSETEVVEGLKTALEIGTDSAVAVLSPQNGYYGNSLLKIPLPEDAEKVRKVITNNAIAQFFSLDSQFEKVIKSMNYAASQAAKEAAPIFSEAISDMSVVDGWEILNGKVPSSAKSAEDNEFDSTAATEYFKIKTTEGLTNLYAPKINTALGQDLGLGFSAVDAWSILIDQYNTQKNKSLVKAAITAAALTGNTIVLPELESDLGEYATEKALDGLFYMVGEEEKKIRKNPWDWAVDIIQKVFGSLFN